MNRHGGPVCHVIQAVSTSFCSLSQLQEALHEIWLQLVQRLLRRCLKMSTFENPKSKDKE